MLWGMICNFMRHDYAVRRHDNNDKRNDYNVTRNHYTIKQHDYIVKQNDCNVKRKVLMLSSMIIHCYKTDGEIPVHTHDDARRQRSKTGKYFPYESRINTCLAPEFFNTSGIFPRYTACKKGKCEHTVGSNPRSLAQLAAAFPLNHKYLACIE
jgi:hypothetical protein